MPKPISRSPIKLPALAAALLLAAVPAFGQDARVEARAGGGDRATAVAVASALLARTWPVQLVRVRCERVGEERFCGLRLSGVKFHRRIDVGDFTTEVDTLVREAFAADSKVVEVDVWATVPREAGKGAPVSGDFALPTSLTVFAVTARRGDAEPSRGPNAFWDPAFRRELENGSSG